MFRRNIHRASNSHESLNQHQLDAEGNEVPRSADPLGASWHCHRTSPIVPLYPRAMTAAALSEVSTTHIFSKLREGRSACGLRNPNGIQAISPGLRGTIYPGKTTDNTITLTGFGSQGDPRGYNPYWLGYVWRCPPR